VHIPPRTIEEWTCLLTYLLTLLYVNWRLFNHLLAYSHNVLRSMDLK